MLLTYAPVEKFAGAVAAWYVGSERAGGRGAGAGGVLEGRPPVSRKGTVKVDVDTNTVVGIVNLGFLIAVWWKLDGKIERMNDKIAVAERSLREDSRTAHSEIVTNINKVDTKVDDLKNILLHGIVVSRKQDDEKD